MNKIHKALEEAAQIARAMQHRAWIAGSQLFILRTDKLEPIVLQYEAQEDIIESTIQALSVPGRIY